MVKKNSHTGHIWQYWISFVLFDINKQKENCENSGFCVYTEHMNQTTHMLIYAHNIMIGQKVQQTKNFHNTLAVFELKNKTLLKTYW